MRVSRIILASWLWTLQASSTIIQNGQVREDPYPGQAPKVALDTPWKTYGPEEPEISYKGRWDSKYVSWWSIPGLKFDFTGDKLALGFGPQTSEGVMVAYRIDGLDWQFSNVTANSVYQFVEPKTAALKRRIRRNAASSTFELRDAHLSKSPEFGKTVEIIGDSLAAGQYATYEGLSSWAYNFAAGLGNVEYSITAYPGICLQDKMCYDNARGMVYQWHQISDSSTRAEATYGKNPEPWSPATQRAADLVVINLGTNDWRKPNEIPSEDFYGSYIQLIGQIHAVWPNAQIIIMSLWGYFDAQGNTWTQIPAYVNAVKRVYQHYQNEGFVHYFDTTGILQHNDIAPGKPELHPTDVGHIKVASHLMQYVKIKFGWEFEATGPEVQHDTTYWNNENEY